FEVFAIGLQEHSRRKSVVVKTKEEDGGSCGVARQPAVDTPNHWRDKRGRWFMSFAEIAYCFVHTHPSTSITSSGNDEKGKEEGAVGEEVEPLIQMVVCRICQEEDHIKNLEAPCACSGSLKVSTHFDNFAFLFSLGILLCRACVQRWCNEKGDITCEICRERMRSNIRKGQRQKEN
ncbi:hypothetical protein B296_00022015, partial [Ensete ventricosum]